MASDSGKLYTESNNLAFGLTSQRDPMILRGKRFLYKPAFYDFADLILTGIPKAELGEYVNDMSSMMARWDMNTVSLKGTDISAPNGEALIKVLPNGYFQYHLYEDSIPEVTRATTTATTKTISAPTITFTLSASEVKRFRENDLIINWSNSESKVARVSAISTTSVSIVAWGNSASAFAAVTDFFVSTTSLDSIQIIGSAHDARNPSTFPADRVYADFEDTTTQKTYNVQLFEDVWIKPKNYDANFRSYGGNMPQAAKNSRDAFLKHKKKISAAMLWGIAQDVASGTNQSSFKGLNSSITTNVTTLADGALSLADIDEMLVDKIGVRMGSNELYCIGSFQTIQIIESLFNSLVATNQADVIRYASGYYSITLSKVIYRGMVIHLIPLSDFTYSNENTQALPTLGASNGTGFAQKLFFIDPAAINIVLAQVNEGSPLFFSVERGVQPPDKTFYYEQNVIRTSLGFALLHEKTSGKIEGIRSADLNG